MTIDSSNINQYSRKHGSQSPEEREREYREARRRESTKRHHHNEHHYYDDRDHRHRNDGGYYGSAVGDGHDRPELSSSPDPVVTNQMMKISELINQTTTAKQARLMQQKPVHHYPTVEDVNNTYFHGKENVTSPQERSNSPPTTKAPVT